MNAGFRMRRAAAALAAACIAASGAACGPPAAAPGAAGPGAAPAAAAAPGAIAPAAAVVLQQPIDLDTPPEFTVIQKGTGPQVKTGDVVLVHYVGHLTRNDPVTGLPKEFLFDDTHRVSQPYAFTVGMGHAIRGFDLLLPKLSVGDRVKTRIRWQLAYGELGVKNGMPGKQDLDYEIEVVAIVPPPTWEVVKTGDGPLPARGRLVSLHYIGTLPSGEQFDDSRTSGKPFQFRLGAGAVIEAWDRVVAHMHVGDRWKVTVPWFYAYGADGLPPKIPPMTDVLFDLELVGVE